MPERPAPGNPVAAAEVRSTFDRIAGVYDAMNSVMSLGLDAGWRRAAASATAVGPGMSAVDVACGTGALTREIARRVRPGGEVLGIDVSEPMLRRARRRRIAATRFLLGDALELPCADGSVDAATIAFGLRNVPDYRRCLAEMARVTRPGGRVVVLEIATPTAPLARLVAGVWFDRVVPLLGRLLARDAAAYRYLPASVRGYPPPRGIAELMRAVGLRDVRWRRLAGGLVTLHVGRRG